MVAVSSGRFHTVGGVKDLMGSCLFPGSEFPQNKSTS